MTPPPVDDLFADYAGPAVPGASVVVIRDGRVILRRAYGMADLERHVAASPATDYRLASVTKQFTAMAVMLLVRDGELRYDQSILDILPELPPAARPVTVRHLLNHTSGLPDYEDLIPDTQTAQVSDRDVLGLLARKDTLYFPPGTQYRYSNSGYVLLGLIVERVSGVRFQEFLRRRIFAPLAMTASVAHVEGADTVPHRAYGYTPGPDGFRPTDQSVTSATLGDGGVYTSVEDLVRWDAALYDDGSWTRRPCGSRRPRPRCPAERRRSTGSAGSWTPTAGCGAGGIPARPAASGTPSSASPTAASP